MRSHQKGFTLVELIVVIVILGILAATALPRFINVTNDARVASVQGFAGGLRSAVGVVQARYFASGSSGSTSVSMVDGTTVTVAAVSGIPEGSTGGIGNALSGCTTGTGACSGFTATFVAGGTSTFQPTNGGGTTCRAEYLDTTGAVTAVTGGC